MGLIYNTGPKDRDSNYSKFLETFGNITDINNFADRFEKHLICGKTNCDCITEFNKIKENLASFFNLAYALNSFYKNMSKGGNGDLFNVGMIPLKLHSLILDDLHQYEYSGEIGKIKFDKTSPCVYSSTINYNSIRNEKAYVVITADNEGIWFSLAGVAKDFVLLMEKSKQYHLHWHS